MRLLVCVLLIVAAVFSAHAEPTLPPFDASQQGELFSLHGSNTVGARLAPELAKDFMEAKGLTRVSIVNQDVENEYQVVGYHPDTRQPFIINLAAHGSSTAFTALAEGRAQIGMSSRAIKPQEVAALEALGDMNSFEAEKIVAIDGLAIIVHKSRDIDELTIDQIAKIFAGEITDWQQLGAAPGKISLLARDDKSGTWDTFKSLVLRNAHQLHPAAARFESNDEISRRVQQNSNAIGFVGLAAVGDAKALAIAHNNTRALLPTQLSVATEDYPLSRRLFMYVSPAHQSPLVREFIAYVQSGAGQSRVTKVGYIAQTPMMLPLASLRGAPAGYRELVENAQRLSVNIRFKDGSASLDNKARQDILRLIQFMQDPKQRERELVLAGFGDAKQTERRAQVLSRLRALAVAFVLREQGLTNLRIEGFGDELPVADNDSGQRTRNQRVEIWLM